MGKAADQLAATLKDLAAHYAEADRHARDGIVRPRPERDGGVNEDLQMLGLPLLDLPVNLGRPL